MPHRRSKEAAKARKKKRKAFDRASCFTDVPEARIQCESGTAGSSSSSKPAASHPARQWSRGIKRRRHRKASPEPDWCGRNALFTECWISGHGQITSNSEDEEPFGDAEAESIELLTKRAQFVREYFEATLALCAAKTNTSCAEPVVKEAAGRKALPKRRSGRRTSAQLEAERVNHLEAAIEALDESSVRVVESSTKGRGVVAAQHFEQYDLVLEYRGELIDSAAARERERLYAADSSVGCYMYYFESAGIKYCVDATAETSFVGRLVNHSAKRPNLLTKVVRVKQQPRLVLIAARSIAPDEELLYDYGERNKDAVVSHPWLRDS